MTDLERLSALEEKYRGLEGDMPPFGDVIFLLRMVAAARRQGAEEATLRAENAEATAYAWADADAYRRGAEEMRERAARLADGFCTDRTDDVARGIRALPLTPEEPT